MKTHRTISYLILIQIIFGFNSFSQTIEPFLEFESRSEPWGLIFTSDNQKILTLDKDFVARLFDLNTGQQIRSFIGHNAALWSACFSPDGTLLATASKDETICIWEALTGSLLFTLSGHQAGVSCVAFSPDGKYLASCSADKSIRTWDIKNGKLLSVFPQTKNAILSISFSPDGKSLLSCGGEYKNGAPSEILVWDVNSKEIVADLKEFNYKFLTYGEFTFNTDQILLRDYPDFLLSAVDIRKREVIKNYPLKPATQYSVGLTPDSDLVFCASLNDITILSMRNDFEPKILNYPEGFTAFGVSPNGKYFATGSDDRRLSRKIRVFQTEKIPEVGDRLKNFYTEQPPEITLKDPIPAEEEITDPKMVEAKELDKNNLIGKFEDYEDGYTTESFLVPYYTTPDFNKELFGLETFNPRPGYIFSTLDQSNLDRMSVENLYNSIQRNGLYTKGNYYDLDYTRIPELTLYFAELKKKSKYDIASEKNEIINLLSKTRKSYLEAYRIYSNMPFKVYGSCFIFEDEYDFDRQLATIHMFLNNKVTGYGHSYPGTVYVASMVVSLSLDNAKNLFVNGMAEGEVIFKLLPGWSRVNLGTGGGGVPDKIMPNLYSVENTQLKFTNKLQQKYQFFASLKGDLWPYSIHASSWHHNKLNRPDDYCRRMIQGGWITN